MNPPAFSLIAGITGLALTSSWVSPSAAQAQTSPVPANGLNGSYLGVTVNADNAWGLGQAYLH